MAGHRVHGLHLAPVALTCSRIDQHAHRRHTARRWHRERGLEPEVAATLEALGKLTYNQRRVLLLTHLATVSLDQMAREVSQTVETTTRELQTATS
ncbi:hypothetical protein, partial [uncultured Nocardioides sp.]|uniref:hypothetical protein n=1 Tax=uncultured Nocardioides sp. TaxID=198441 RepID=UPI00262C0E8D